jgi:hypothetical protein
MLNSSTRHLSESADRLFRFVPRRSAQRLYRILESSVRRVLKIQADTAATPERTPVGSTVRENVPPAAPVLQRLPGSRIRPDDAQVREWKGTWVRGAESRWAGTSVLANPHKPGSPRAAAWRAGWHWADRQPDRRQPRLVRFAHPQRRRTDQSSRLVRSAQAGAVGVSMLTIAGWLWQMRRKRARRDSGV